MNRSIERCAMLDIHKSQITACVRVRDEAGGRREEVREFAATTSGLLTLADWLRSWLSDGDRDGVHRRVLAGRCLYLLEDEFECRLYNARLSSSRPRSQERRSKTPSLGLPAARILGLVPAELRAGAAAAANCATWSGRSQGEDPGAHPVRSSGWEKTLAGRRGSSSPRSPRSVLGVLRPADVFDALISGHRTTRKILAELAKGTLRKKIPALRRSAPKAASPGHHALLIVPNARADRLPRRNDRHAV